MLADAWSGLLLAAILVGPPVLGAEEPPEARAATQVIQSLEGVLGNLSAVRNLPPAQRVAWVLIHDGIPVLNLEGEPGVTYRIQASDLQPGSWWCSVTTLTPTGADQNWSDSNAASWPARSYRAVWVP